MELSPLYCDVCKNPIPRWRGESRTKGASVLLSPPRHMSTFPFTLSRLTFFVSRVVDCTA